MNPTVVLVHGAFADSSSWNGVVERLQAAGYPVIAAANPLRGLASDADAVAQVVESVDGPVVLVGHSYGGVLISAAARDNVKALVYVAAFQPDTGENALALSEDGKLGPDTTRTIGGDVYIKPENFADVFAADVPQAAVLAATQRPVFGGALGDAFPGEPAWKRIPSFALIALEDNAIPAAAQQRMAKRAGSEIVEVSASHAVSVSQPQAVFELIERAATA
ncbi:alpha/beta hydrolase [Lentzea sp. NBRC 105346]|uniref:alpha/beta fold hydrolase n=1 Tax=Lentzea sp. NBRC 105346 TaxID=3032205 RepID=UPI0024A12533|nr:alpha/beta hydrolase [Lentzea sp. NBRC 105346]GLZ30052.1 alpha/beta hydrolase [Lentzea sp. NBRC 105346]